MLELTREDLLRHAVDMACDVAEEALALRRIEQPEQRGRLAVVVLVVTMVVTVHCACCERRLGCVAILREVTEAIRLVVHRRAKVAVRAHAAITMERMLTLHARGVHRNLMMV